MKTATLTIITAILITIMLPLRGLIGLSVHRGEVWDDKPITAPFDIPISKTALEIEKDKALIASSYTPMFRVDTTAWQDDIDDSLLIKIYNTGVISQNDYDRYTYKTINLLRGNIAIPKPTIELFTPESAAEYLSSRNVKNIPNIEPNIVYDEKLNAAAREDFINSVSTTRGVIRAGEIIINTGQVIDENTELLLNSYINEFEARMGDSYKLWLVILGRFLVVMAILTVNILFFRKFAKLYFGEKLKPIVFTFALYFIMAALVAITMQYRVLNPMLVPLPIVAIYLLTFFNIRVAIFGNISVAIICALFTRIPFEFFMVNFTGGMVAIFMLQHFYHRANLFKAVGVVFAAEASMLLCFSLISTADVNQALFYTMIYVIIGTFLMLGFYQAIYLIERIFGFVSDLTLLELSDTNQKLLLGMAQQAPGTFQHSVQVANLAESAAKAIDARPLLARCGALYHDVGKMKNPFFFAENLSGNFNPHDNFTPEASAAIIRRHVNDGVQTAHDDKLPKQIIDFIERHHGNSLIYYFYAKAKENNPNVSSDDFRYPGPNPISKEVSICMMADAVEAASRSMPSYDKQALDILVDRIIDTQISEGLLSDSQLSFAEVGKIKEVFKSKLNNIYHGRIAYPDRIS